MNALLKRYLIAVVIIALAVVLLAPQPEVRPQRTAGADDAWVVPRIGSQGGNSASMLRDLVQSRLWGAAADNANPMDEKASRWRVAGITGKHSERYVIIQFGDDRIQELKAGDKFPDGTLISEVREPGICVLLSGKRRFLPIDGQMPPIVW
ncbi:MAG: hypothetical protein ING66_16540 [Rhodocyclaceae bacterium]|nr:hypothetical protein [Rhodocyclaceae bacterium]MCA3019562.1 hypothetical protein [Rhodocyclaceae bacterium]MCA3023419.1 hypothetical protein [Rhodocyclaceae bacterium]MCA3026121.1 hypothetical protein [Rhodocyclaceae bacterium]MCA3030193.1 hypothetical protein [Rhodocyclaceae bacterium]